MVFVNRTRLESECESGLSGSLVNSTQNLLDFTSKTMQTYFNKTGG